MGSLAEVVEVIQRLPSELLGCNLERPLTGAQEDAGSLPVSGWALCRDVPMIAVEVVHADTVISRTTSLHDRPDIAVTFPGHPGADRAGFHLMVAGVWGGPTELQVLAVLSDRTRSQIGTIHVCGSSHDEEALPISVVIPCYDQAHFLPDAIRSVLSQTYSNVEVVVVDDGSHDNVGVVVAQYPGVRRIRRQNGGLAAARNTGIRESTGEFLVFLDADDMLLPDALKAGVDCFERHPDCDVALGRFRRVDRDGRLRSLSTLPTSDDHYRTLLERNHISMFATCMIRRRVFDEVGGFDETLHAAEDYDLYLRIARDHSLQCHDTTVADYRLAGHNMSNDAGLMLDSVMRVMRRQRRYARQRGDLRLAYAGGLRGWRELYGPMALEQVDGAIAAHDWRKSLRGLTTLLRYDRMALPEVARRVIARSRLRRNGPYGAI